MLQIQTKLTSQGQVSVPAAIRHLLALTPGATIVWTEDKGQVTVQRAVRSTTADLHAALFPSDVPIPKTLQELKQGIKQYIKQKHTRKTNTSS
jgi:antitoxin PrlF